MMNEKSETINVSIVITTEYGEQYSKTDNLSKDEFDELLEYFQKIPQMDLLKLETIRGFVFIPHDVLQKSLIEVIVLGKQNAE